MTNSSNLPSFQPTAQTQRQFQTDSNQAVNKAPKQSKHLKSVPGRNAQVSSMRQANHHVRTPTPYPVRFESASAPSSKHASFTVAGFLESAKDEKTFPKAMNDLYKHLCCAPESVKQNTLDELKSLQKTMTPKAFFDTYNFQFPQNDTLMQGGIEFKSVFGSEEWSKVMVAAIKESGAAIAGKDIVDVGCGNFCFGRAALKESAHSAAGLDLNPDAVLNAKINQVLFYGQAKEQVMVSDLLSALLEKDQKVDTIIACIPQILNPSANSEETTQDELSKASLADKERYSHQTPPAGGEFAAFDPYGLGLVARLLKQAPEALKPGGQLLMNVAGRPGQQIIDQMFSEFNCTAKPVVTKVFEQQTTGDEKVDIEFFVDQEKNNPDIHFTFYADKACEQTLSATEAQQLLDAGSPVYHSLTCYNVQPNQ